MIPSATLFDVCQRVARRGGLQALTAIALLGSLSACGKTAAPTASVAAPTADASGLVKLGFGKTGGVQPALAHVATGWLMVFAGANSGNRHLYSTTSTDGIHWSAEAPVGTSDYTDQNPVLVADSQGNVHLYFASNRDGNDFQLFHSSYSKGSFGAATAIANTTGADDLAVAYAGNRFVLAAEIVGTGLVTSTSTDGLTFGSQETAAAQGFEPALAALPNGSFLLAYTSSGVVMAHLGKPGAWGKELTAAKGTSRLHDPALLWAGTSGTLAYSESEAGSFHLHTRSFDAKGSFGAETTLDSAGDARTPTLASDPNGTTGLAWGMKNDNGQQGVVFSSAALSSGK